MTKNEIVGRLRDGGLDASSTNRSAAVYVADAREGRAAPGWFAYRIICESDATERRARGILSRWYDIEASGNVWRLRSRNRVPLMAIKRGGVPPTPPTPPTVEYMYFEAAEANSTVSMMSTLETAPDLEYSTDGETWQEWQHTTADGAHTFDTLTLTAVGDKVYFRGDNPEGLGAMPEGADMPLFSHFDMTGKIAPGGNIMSLLDKDAEMTEVPELGFFLLFGDSTGENPNTSLTTAAAMPSLTTIGEGGCYYMYENCTSITAAANMPSLTTIGEGGCAYMYGGCTSITSAAAMPVVTTIGYFGCAYMYGSCTSLTSAADMPSLTTIGKDGCYSMYVDCTSITAAANMPSLTTIGKDGCYSMYVDCTSITAAADMPSLTTIGKDGCYSMYGGCAFDMSNDGTTFNFEFGATPPVTAGETTYNTYYDLARWMGNTNGFTNP